MPELVISVTNIISPLCYTVLKVEPYTICPFKCVYCYSKWYMKSYTDYVYPRFKALGMFKDFVHRVYRKGLKPIPFRLSTLVEPFPPVEQLYRITEKILKIAIEFEYPMIINTKSIFYTYNPLRNALEKLLDKKLALLQISISVLSNSLAQKIEPKAPAPKQRLNAVKDLGLTDIPLVLRLSPYIPYLSPTQDNEIEAFASICKDLGVKHVIIESLRIEVERANEFLQLLGVQGVPMESYSIREVKGMKPLYRISTAIREKIYGALAWELGKHGIRFATCKEGLFKLHTSPDCCGVYLLEDGVLRLTLYDIYRYTIESGQKIQMPIDMSRIKEICKKYSRICLDELRGYPRMVLKMLKYHEKKLIKILQKVDLLKHVAPHIVDVVSSRVE